MRQSEKLNKRLKEIESDAVQGIKDFFRLSESGRYVFNEPFGSILNETISVNGVLVERSLKDGQTFYLIGENEDGEEFHEDRIGECNVQDLILVLIELENKKYGFEKSN